jgi:hypothetical protein
LLRVVIVAHVLVVDGSCTTNTSLQCSTIFNNNTTTTKRTLSRSRWLPDGLVVSYSKRRLLLPLLLVLLPVLVVAMVVVVVVVVMMIQKKRQCDNVLRSVQRLMTPSS